MIYTRTSIKSESGVEMRMVHPAVRLKLRIGMNRVRVDVGPQAPRKTRAPMFSDFLYFEDDLHHFPYTRFTRVFVLFMPPVGRLDTGERG